MLGEHAKMFGKPYGIPNIFINFAVEFQNVAQWSLLSSLKIRLQV